MGGVMEMTCPKGHASTEIDFCSECGAKMPGVAAASLHSAGATSNSGGAAKSVGACPDCGATRDAGTFCEVCGHNFVTGARGEIPVRTADPVDAPAATRAAAIPAAADAPEPAPTRAQVWTVVASVDPSLRGEDSPEAPVGFAPVAIELQARASLIGRRSETRAIFPEISLDRDDAVSHRHALLQRGDDGSLALRDIGAANGTRVNGKDVEPLKDVPLEDGDEITLGHWTRLTVRAVR